MPSRPNTDKSIKVERNISHVGAYVNRIFEGHHAPELVVAQKPKPSSKFKAVAPKTILKPKAGPKNGKGAQGKGVTSSPSPQQSRSSKAKARA